MNQPDPIDTEAIAALQATVETACARSARYDTPRTTTDTGTGYVMVDAFFLQALLAALATAEERAENAEKVIEAARVIRRPADGPAEDIERWERLSDAVIAYENARPGATGEGS